MNVYKEYQTKFNEQKFEALNENDDEDENEN